MKKVFKKYLNMLFKIVILLSVDLENTGFIPINEFDFDLLVFNVCTRLFLMIFPSH